jgi:hypothetical protein
METLLEAVTKDAEPRVQSHAVAAMINFTEECDVKILSKLLDPILTVLYSALETKFKEVRMDGSSMLIFVLSVPKFGTDFLFFIITEIASLADKIEDKFAPYYEKYCGILSVGFHFVLLSF